MLEVNKPNPTARITPIKALIVDDEIEICELLSEILKDAGIEAHTSSDGWQALEKIQQDKYDILLVDHSMPKMNGYEFIEKAQKLLSSSELPKVVLTSGGSAASPEKLNRNKELGIDGVIPKPFQFDNILPQINKVLSYQDQGPEIKIN